MDVNIYKKSLPQKSSLKQDDVTHNHFYWLKVRKPEAYSLIIASIEGQVITVINTTVPDYNQVKR